MRLGSRPRSEAARTGSSAEPSIRRSFDSLVSEYGAFVWRVLRRMGLSSADADDATQQVFMVAARKMDGIAPERARAFLYGTAIRVASNARRGLSRRRELLEDPIDRAAPEGQGPEELTELHRARALLDELLRQLPEELTRVLVLAEIEQLEVAEIANLEAIPVGTAASRLRRARSRFGDLLASVEDRNPFRRSP